MSREANPRYHALLTNFMTRTGVPVLLNTSFNKQEPIVCSPEEAISCYLRTDMDVLVMGNCYCSDRTPGAQDLARNAFPVLAQNLRGDE